MGKAEDDEFPFSSNAAGVDGSLGSNVERRGCSNKFSRFIGLRCLLALLLGISVFLPAVFWVLPFLNLRDHGDSDLDPRYRGHMVVASFTLRKQVSFLKDNREQLETDIYYELEAARTKVTILSMESSPGSNVTTIVFGVDPESKHSSLSLAELSLIRSSFESLVIRQTDLQLTTSLFGQPKSFEVLKFPGGITLSPPQISYPLQKVQILFNFTLNNSILQMEDNFDELKHQLKTGLHLTANENLHIRLRNYRGSTVAPPATVLTSVVLAIGIPSVPRLKQLAHTIKDSPARNLGLNNHVFGKVKQISLSSVLQHSLNGDANSPSPAPSPQPHAHHHYHHYHRDYRHHEDHGSYLPPHNAPSYAPSQAPTRPVKRSRAPQISALPPMKCHDAVSPANAPSPSKSYQAKSPAARAPSRSYHAEFPPTQAPAKDYHASPPGCKFGFKSRPAQAPVGVVRPIMSPHHIAAPPNLHVFYPPPAMHHWVSPSSPVPNVIYSRVPPPSESEMDREPPDKMPSISLSPSAGDHLVGAHLGVSVILALLFHFW